MFVYCFTEAKNIKKTNFKKEKERKGKAGEKEGRRGRRKEEGYKSIRKWMSST